MRKSKSCNTTLTRPGSTLDENRDVQVLANKHGTLVGQNYSDWMDEYLISDDDIPHLKRNLPRGSMMFDNFSAHSPEKVIASVNSKKIPFTHLPPNCTPIIQPLDMNIDGAFKAKIKKKFIDWFVNRFDDVIYLMPIPLKSFRKKSVIRSL